MVQLIICDNRVLTVHYVGSEAIKWRRKQVIERTGINSGECREDIEEIRKPQQSSWDHCHCVGVCQTT